MSEQALADIAAINAVIADPVPTPPKPRPTRKPVPVPAPASVEADDDNDDDALPDIPFPSRPCRAPVEVKPVVEAGPIVYREDGYPCIASDTEVKAATSNVEQLKARLVEARERESAAAAKLGVGAGEYDHNRTEKLAARWIEQGGDEDAVEEYHATGRKLRRLEEAVRIAEAKVQPSRERAMRRLYDAAQKRLAPSFVAMQRALIVAAKAVCDHVDEIDAASRAGFPPSNDLSLFSTQIPRNRFAAREFFKGLVTKGILSAADLEPLS